MHRPPANAAAHAHAALAAARFLLLAAALLPASARCGREMTLRAFSDEVRGRVVDRLADALGDKAFASVSVGGVVTFAADGFLFVQCDGEGLKVETKPGAGPAARPGDLVEVGGSPSLEGGRIVLRAASVEKDGSEPLPPPRDVMMSDLVYAGDDRSGVNWLRVTLAGRAIGPTERGFAVDVSGLPVNVMCDDPPDFLDDSAHSRPKVIVTGVVELMLDPSVLLGRDSFVMGVKMHAAGADVALVPDIAYIAAKRSRAVVLGAAAVSAVLAVLLAAFAFQTLRQRRRLIRSRAVLAERRRMADDLHDTIEQHLVGAAMLVRLGRAKEAEDVLVRAKREIRDVVWGLKNDDMMRLSPAEMLRSLAATENAKGLYRVDTRLSGLPQKMDASRMRDLSLVVREAVGNAVKHGGAKKIAVTCDASAGGGWLLRVANDGTPFDPATAPGAADGHFGVEGMRQRARRLGATISFSTRDGWTVLTLAADGKGGGAA